MHKIVLLCCAGIASSSLFGMQMEQTKITPLPHQQTISTQNTPHPKHSIWTKGCACFLCCIPVALADTLCITPLCCRLSPIQKPNETDSEWMDRAEVNDGHEAEHRAAMKALHGNDACSSLHRKINALLYEKAPHHTQRCEVESEHLCCFSKALIKFAQE